MSAQNMDVAKAVSLFNQAIELTEEKKKLLIQLRDALIREHGHGEDFPRPMSVRENTLTHGRNADCPDVQSGRWTRCIGHKSHA